MKNIVWIILGIVIGFNSCKKEEPVAPSVSVTPIVDGTVSNSSTYSGILQLYKVFTVTDADTLAWASYLTPHASFSQTPVGFMQNANVATVDSLFFNNVKMSYDGSYYYEDNSYTIYNQPFVWQLYGKGVIPSFTYTNPNSLPVYTGCATLPDSVKLGKALSFDVSGLSGHSKLICFLSDGNGGLVFKDFINQNSSIHVSFSESETSGMTASANMLIGIWIIKDNVRYFGGKSFNFTTELLISKPLSVQ